MFDYGHANKAQKEAINSTEGPLLIIAGPGTGKTFTLVKRAVYLIQECGVKPEQIMMATFTEKAAKELITRITNELSARNISVNINEMYIGTFHSICLRIIKEHLEFTRLKKNYRLIDAFEQKYLVYKNFHKRFNSVEGIDELFKGNFWGKADAICGYVNQLAEEMVDCKKMQLDSDSKIKTLGKVFEAYQKMLEEEDLIDFSTIQTECYKLLVDNESVLNELRNQIKYLMIDEYQDTNYIQEKLVFLLGKEYQNICVVGDDDQGLYRFRGATIRNILEFPEKFEKGKCKKIALTTNYRSNSDIVDFYNKWMLTTSGSDFDFSWDNYRYDKTIVPHEKTKIQSSAVIKLSSKDNEDEWHKKIFEFIKELKDSGRVTDYNQIAFLFNSVKNNKVRQLADYLENNHISVYSPRSDMFFERDEIKMALGCLMLMFPKYVEKLEKKEFKYLDGQSKKDKKEIHRKYYMDCCSLVKGYVSKTENKKLLQFIKKYGMKHYSLKKTTDYAYSGLLYKLFQHEPFKKILETDMSEGVVDVRPSRNLAMLTQIIGKFEHLYNIDVLSGRRIENDTEILFNNYLKGLYDEGIYEYEDESEYAPSGCVSFLTIHQSKGMEFPIVFVGSLEKCPRNRNNQQFLLKIEEKYFNRSAYEPDDKKKFFDFWRLYYTAFSRAQDLLILTCDENKSTPSKYFKNMYTYVPSAESEKFDMSDFKFHSVKNVNLKTAFSFTSQIAVYETCPLQYKFYKELGFVPVRNSAMLFGTLVHETIEDIHRAAIRDEANQITRENIASWLDANYSSLSQSEHMYLDSTRKMIALKQVENYAERMAGKWDMIRQAEVDVSLVKYDYIIDGKIDLVKGIGDTVDLVDFKSEKKPDVNSNNERLERYRRQLQLYAYLVEQRTGHKVDKMNLYYTAEENSNPVISFKNTPTAIEGSVEAFDDTVHKILKKDFNHRCDDAKVCSNCDFRYLCGRNK